MRACTAMNNTPSILIPYLVVVLIVILFLFVQPLIVLVVTWWKSNFSDEYLRQNLPYATDISGFAGLPDIKRGDQLLGQAASGGQETCENGFYIGMTQMANADCTSICNATSSKQFTYRYIDSNNIVVNNRYLRKGGWCLPTSLARCNLNISTAVKSLGKYECVSRYPQLLGGPYGNDIVGCAPNYEFDDNLRKLTYTNSVPSTLVIGGDLDEHTPDGEYRYTCNTRNKQFASFGDHRPDLGNRFQLFYDSCNFFDEGGQTVGSKCKCSSRQQSSVIKPLFNDQDTSTEPICSQCTSGYEIVDERLPQFGSKYGVSIGVNCVDPVNIEYYKTQHIEMNGVIPCGVQTLLTLRNSNDESKKYGCQRALINATNTYSPEMLQHING